MTTFFSELAQWFLAFGDAYFLKATLRDFAVCVVSYIVRLYPYVILGSFFGEFLKYTSWTKLIYRFTQKRRLVSVLFATLLGVLVSAIAGIPIYACGGGTIPLVSSLLEQGLSRGSALAFLTVGPATRITSLAAIATIFKKRFLLLYVLVLIILAVAAGMLLV